MWSLELKLTEAEHQRLLEVVGEKLDDLESLQAKLKAAKPRRESRRVLVRDLPAQEAAAVEPAAPVVRRRWKDRDVFVHPVSRWC